MHMQTLPWIHCTTCIIVCCYAHWCNDYALKHVHADTHLQICTHSHTHTKFCLYPHSLFLILIFEYSFFPPSPQVPGGLSASVHRHISFCSVVSMEPPVSCDLSPPLFGESRASGHSESLPPLPLSAFVLKKIRPRKGTKRIKGNESTDISWRLLLLSKWRIVPFVLTHLITPPPHILCSTSRLYLSTPHYPCFILTCSPCSSHPIFIIRSQFSSFPSIIEEWVKINNSQPIKGKPTYISLAPASQ